MTKRSVRWLYEELPGLVAAGVLTPDTAARLREHYGPVDGRPGRQIFLVIFSVLAALLIGAGVILLLAHNWSEMSRSWRTALAFVPLVLTQALAVWVMAQRRSSLAWREGAATIWMLAIPAGIALVDQTYHVGGSLDDFLLAWALLGLPVMFLLDAVTPVLIYLAVTLFWAGYADLEGGAQAWLWLLGAVGMVYLFLLTQAQRYGNRTALAGWGLAAWLSIAPSLTLRSAAEREWYLVYLSLFGGMYLAGRLWYRADVSLWRRPFQIVGALGVVGWSFGLAFRRSWEYLGDLWLVVRNHPGFFEIVVVVALLAAVGLLTVSLVRRQWTMLPFGVAPLIALTAVLISFGNPNVLWLCVLFNAYLVVLGLTTLVSGVRAGSLAKANAGVALLVLLLVVRFFDSDFSMLTRGLVCVGAGVAFLVTNLLLRRSTKEPANMQAGVGEVKP
jgi:uncharacterized membrane protein